jgi:hypothetical protein
MTQYSTDPYWSSVALAMPMDGANNSTTFSDLKDNPFTASGNAKISTIQSRFGGSSAYFDGSGDYLTASSANFLLGNGQFTLEAWVRPDNLSALQKIFGIWADTSGAGFSWKIQVATTGAVQFVYSTTGGNYFSLETAAGKVSATTWAHIAVTRDVSNIIRIFVNGVIEYTSAAISATFFAVASNKLFEVGRDGAGTTNYVTGYIDDIQITKGIARYTANFTPVAIMSWWRELVLTQTDLAYLYLAISRFATDLTYLATPTLKGLADLPYASRLLPRAQVDLAYRHRPLSGSVVDLPYGSLTVARAETDCPYLMSAGIVVNHQDLAYRITDQVVVGAQIDLPYWGEASPALVNIAAACTVAGVTVEPLAMDLTWSRDQYSLSASLTLATGSDYALAQVGAAVVLTLQGTDYHLQVESRQRQRTHGEWSYTIACLSPAAWLDAPYSATINGAQTGLASVVSATLAGSVSLSWQTVDWTLAAGDLFATDQAPLALIRQLAAAPGGIIVSLPDGSLVVEPAYPVPVNRWSQSAPATVIRESMDVISASESDDYRPGYNVYLITDQVTTADTLRIDTEAESELVSLLRVYQTPWADDFDFRHTGGNWVQLEDLGIEERQVEEVIEFIAGEGRTQFPVYSLETANWQQINLGAVSFIEAGTLTAAVEGESLLALTYITRCRKYRARDSRSEQVQFVAEVTA